VKERIGKELENMGFVVKCPVKKIGDHDVSALEGIGEIDILAVKPEGVKLELQSEELRQEIGWEHGRSYTEKEMQRRIANAIFKALPLIGGTQQLFNQVADLYKDFGEVGREVALGMLSAEDWRIRAAACFCLSKVGEASDVNVVLPLLKDEQPLLRVSVAQSLVSFPSDDTRKALQAASGDVDRRVRRAIEDTLKTIAKAK